MSVWLYFFFVNDTATTEIYTYGHTLARHDALPSYQRTAREPLQHAKQHERVERARHAAQEREDTEADDRIDEPAHGAEAHREPAGERHADRVDRKSTRLTSSH